jgi:hypothetical protein
MTRPKRPKAKQQRKRKEKLPVLRITNCAYCGGMAAAQIDDVPSDADVARDIRAHIEACPKHPLAKARREIGALNRRILALKRALALKKAGRR